MGRNTTTRRRIHVGEVLALALLAPLGPAAWGAPYDSIAAWNVEVVGQIGGGQGEAVRVAGDYAYLCVGRNLVILDVSDPDEPTPVRRVPFAGTAAALDIDGSLAFVPAAGQLHVIDVSQPLSPQVRAVYSPPDPCVAGVHAAGGRVYCIGYHPPTQPGPDHTFQVIDVSDPTSPTFLGSCGGISSSFKWAIDVSDGLAYVGNGNLALIDVTAPSTPVRLQSPIGFVYGMEVSGRRAYLASGSLGFRIADFTDPLSPAILTHWQPTVTGIYRLDVVGDRVYIGEWQALGFRILDIADPSSPTLRGSLAASTVLQDIEDVVASATLVFCACRPGLQIIDAGDPDRPVPLGTVVEPEVCRFVQTTGGLAYVVAEEGPQKRTSFHVLDVHTPGGPIPLGHCDLGPRGYGRVATVANGFAYMLGISGLQIVDVGDPTSPTVRWGGRFDLAFNTKAGVHVDGDLLYADADSFRIFDVSDPSSPVLLHTHETIDVYQDFALSRDLLFSPNPNRLEVFDLSDPSSPVLLGVFEGAAGEDIEVLGDRAYITRSGQELRIFDVSNPASPTLLGSTVCPAFIHASGTTVYSYQWALPRVDLIDASDPTSPTHTGSFAVVGVPPGTGPYAFAVSVSDDVIYAALGPEGLWMLRYNDPRPAWSAARSRWSVYD